MHYEELYKEYETLAEQAKKSWCVPPEMQQRIDVAWMSWRIEWEDDFAKELIENGITPKGFRLKTDPTWENDWIRMIERTEMTYKLEDNSLKKMVKGGVKFSHAKDDALWYVTDCGYEFPVPYHDTAGATFLPEDRGRYFMRWIRTAIDMQRLKETEIAEARAEFEKETKVAVNG